MDGVLVDQKTNLENEFTKLLMQLAENKKRYFDSYRENISIICTYVNKVYLPLMESIRKPLRKDEIHIIINTLENMNRHPVGPSKITNR